MSNHFRSSSGGIGKVQIKATEKNAILFVSQSAVK